ncbi:MAG: AraC family transcriptional regulator [Enterococcus sp.]
MKPLYLKELVAHGDEYFHFSIHSLHYTDNRISLSRKHWHSEMELLFVATGEAILEVENKTIHLTEGSLVFLPNEIIHELTSNTPGVKQFYCLIFGEEFIKIPQYEHSFFNFSEFDTLHFTLLNSVQYKKILEIISQILDAYVEQKHGAELLIRGNLFLIFYYLFQNLDTSKLPRFVVENTLDHRSQYIMNYINHHYREQISITDIASLLHITPAYFCRFFKKEFNCTFSSYLRKYRLGKSTLLLRTTSMPIIDVSYACGFSSNQYFSSVFFKEYSQTPSNYRKKYHLSKIE